MQELIQLGKEYHLAKSNYEQYVRDIIRNSTVIQNKALFWQMIDDLTIFIQKDLKKRDDPFRNGIHNWMRVVYIVGGDGYDFENLPAFILTYSKLKESLAKKILLIENNLSDLIDALPLAGKQSCLIVLSGMVLTLENLQEILYKTDRLGSQIMTKENHVEQWLEQAYSDKLRESLTRFFS